MKGLRRFLRRTGIVCLAGFVVYGLAAWAISYLPGVEHLPDLTIWPAFLPGWPMVAFLVVGAAVLAADAIVWVAVESRAKGERERLEELAARWSSRSEARVAATTGVPALRVPRFRAQALPAAIRLDWTEPAATYDRILIYRSAQGFATSPAGDPGQAVAYEGEENQFVDGPLAGGRVFFYTAFAFGRAGQASPPAWAWAVALHPGERVSGPLDEASPQVPGDQRH